MAVRLDNIYALLEGSTEDENADPQQVAQPAEKKERKPAKPTATQGAAVAARLGGSAATAPAPARDTADRGRGRGRGAGRGGGRREDAAEGDLTAPGSQGGRGRGTRSGRGGYEGRNGSRQYDRRDGTGRG